MPKAYEPAYHPRPTCIGFWLDSYLTNYGFSVVEHKGVLYALGWAEEPTLVDNLREVKRYEEKIPLGQCDEGKPSGVVHPGGYYGPLPVPSHRRYEMRKRKEEFRNNPPSGLSKVPLSLLDVLKVVVQVT